MIDVVSRHGGHLAPSLGSLDLTIALHYVFNTPSDKIVWDVGHQAYGHKMLTGRRELFHTLRQHGGLSGFPRSSESEYDPVSVGHASTSISVALGLALARDMRGETHKVVAVIGDGALSGGLALEGLNNTGNTDTDLIIVLNDNEMSISRNVGALSRYLTRVITDERYAKLKDEIWRRLGRFDLGKSIRAAVSSIDDALKRVVVPGRLFEDMGIRYLGPIDGHNIQDMIELFTHVRDMPHGPTIVHVQTRKGKGYSFAEDDATRFHGVGSFSRSTGTSVNTAGGAPSYSEVFGRALLDIGRQDERVVAITAAMPDGTKVSMFRDEFPERFFDVGIAEGHAVTFASGLARAGCVPVVAVYSTFLQRAYDNIVHDVALDGLHVVFAVDRAGLVGDDGPTHHGVFDLSFVRSIPGVTVLAPRDENELRQMFYTAVMHLTGPVFVRYPRGPGRGVAVQQDFGAVVLSPEQIRKGSKLAIVSVGHMFGVASEVADALNGHKLKAALIDARCVKPLDHSFYGTLFSTYAHVVTLEPNSVAGGFGSSLMELLSDVAPHSACRILPLGYPDSFVSHGTIGDLHKEIGLDVESVVKRTLAFVGK